MYKRQEYKCNHCEEIFSKRSNLKRHIDALEDNSNSGSNKVINIVYNCDECNEEYMDKRSLKRHEKKHDTTGIKYNCSSCEKSFNTVTSLNTHKTNYHCSEDERKCKYCKKNSTSKTNAQKHLKIIMVADETDQSSSQLSSQDEIYSSQLSSQDENSSSHLSSQLYICDKCKGKFNEERELETHESICYKTIFTKISSFRFFHILREYENKLYTTKI